MQPGCLLALWHLVGLFLFQVKCFSNKDLLRYLGITHPELCKKVLTKHRNLMIAGGIWFYAFLMVFPTITGDFGKFGYNERLQKCDYMDDEDDIDEDLRRLFYSIEFGLPFILIVVSYFGIWRKTTKLASFLKPHL